MWKTEGEADTAVCPSTRVWLTKQFWLVPKRDRSPLLYPCHTLYFPCGQSWKFEYMQKAHPALVSWLP